MTGLADYGAAVRTWPREMAHLAIAQHVVLALILTGLLVCQARSLAIVLRRRRAMPTDGRQRGTDMVWIAIPLVVVLFLAVRCWILALDLGAPVAAGPMLDW